MRWIAIVVGVLVLLTGAVWLLQGVGILPGSVMTGQAFWAVMGLIFIVVGGAICRFGLRRKATTPQA